MGLLIESESLVSEMVDRVRVQIPMIAYRLQLDEQGRISWHANIDGHEVVETKDPLTRWWQRFTAWLLKIVPEEQL